MASKVVVMLEDDLDGGPAQETVRFGVGGAEYEIDLSKKNARAFRKQLAPYLEHARRAGRGQRRRRRVPRRAASAPARSGRGRASRASRSAAAGAPRPAWWRSTTPLPTGADARRDHRRAPAGPGPGDPGVANPDLELALTPTGTPVIAGGDGAR